MQLGFFDWEDRLKKLDKNGDPLVKLNQVISWESFRGLLNKVREKDKKSNAGAKPYDVVLMFKIVILQSLYNLSDEAMEYQILDRISFMRFLGLREGSKVPDDKTIWLFREQLKEANLVEKLFRRFSSILRESGFNAKKGQIIDASIVPVPQQHNSHKENAQIKAGEVPGEWEEAKWRQKDTDAQWAKRNGKGYYGYKNHVNVDVKYKLIRRYEVTGAAVHGSRVMGKILDGSNTNTEVYGDSAYRSREIIERLKLGGFRERLQYKGSWGNGVSRWQKELNRKRAKIRSRVEHVFGVMAKVGGSLLARGIGIIRARVKIGLRNLAYNFNRYALLVTMG